jgi:ArsR family transcriptional regulator, arsenate/arsenite/antimonite-responsive transcriptional repressor
MEPTSVIKRLFALAQESRLAVFRLLIRAGREGIPAGEISRALGIAPNTLSTQLNILANAGLVTSRRAGRSIIYAANYDGASELLLYLMEDCCQGRPEVCAPLADFAVRGACRDQREGALS